jgi:hypothetical protein
MPTKEVRVRVAEAKQRDAGRGTARIGDEAMRALNLVAGDVIAIQGLRKTAVVVWPAYPDDQDRNVIHMDGLLQNNAGVALDEYVVIAKADVHAATAVTLAPVDMRLSVGKDFTNYVKRRLQSVPLVQGDAIVVVLLGSAMPFTVETTEPQGVVTVSPMTCLHVEDRPYLSMTERKQIAEQLRLHRFAWLKEVESKYAAESTTFSVPDGVESDKEDSVLQDAMKQARATSQPVTVVVNLWATRGKIGSLPWAAVQPDGAIEYTYETTLNWIQPKSRFREGNASLFREIERSNPAYHRAVFGLPPITWYWILGLGGLLVAYLLTRNPLVGLVFLLIVGSVASLIAFNRYFIWKQRSKR